MCSSLCTSPDGSHVQCCAVYIPFGQQGLNRVTIPYTSEFFTLIMSSILPFALYFQVLSLQVVIYIFLDQVWFSTQANETCYLSNIGYYECIVYNNMHTIHCDWDFLSVFRLFMYVDCIMNCILSRYTIWSWSLPRLTSLYVQD